MEQPGLRLHLAPERRLAMTFALRQALEVLQMPQIELAQWLQGEIDSNPLLEELPSSKSDSSQEEVQAPVSLHEHLMSQIRENFDAPADRLLARAILEHLDEKGFLAATIDEIAFALQQPEGRIGSVLEVLQTFEPPGIFARNLRETLLLQLRASQETHTPAYHLVRDGFDDLLQGRFSVIKKKMGMNDLASAIQRLTRLQFRPLSVFSDKLAPTVIADLRFNATGKRWSVEMNEEELPKFQLHAEYASLAPESSEEKESLRAWTTAAKWLFRSLNRRRRILLDIGVFLARKQGPYLTQKGNLRPLSLQDLAAHLGLHESTLSRALSGKYADTPRGILPLRSLLSSFPSADLAKEALAQLIAAEDRKNPLTDKQLSAELRAKGHDIARRTIAKYRKDLRIGDTASRKHLRTS